MPTREELSNQYGKDNVWTYGELIKVFSVGIFLNPFRFVRRKSDSIRGTVIFSSDHGLYYAFIPWPEKEDNG